MISTFVVFLSDSSFRLFDNKKSLEPTYPSTKPSQGERTGQYEDIDEPERTLLEHAPPGYYCCLDALANT